METLFHAASVILPAFIHSHMEKPTGGVIRRLRERFAERAEYTRDKQVAVARSYADMIENHINALTNKEVDALREQDEAVLTMPVPDEGDDPDEHLVKLIEQELKDREPEAWHHVGFDYEMSAFLLQPNLEDDDLRKARVDEEDTPKTKDPPAVFSTIRKILDRKPSARSRSVFVGNIPYDASEELLISVFREVAPVVSFRLVFDKDTGKTKGYGFCEYATAAHAESAVRNLNLRFLHGKALRVDHAEDTKKDSVVIED